LQRGQNTSGPSNDHLPTQPQLVQQERRFYFIACENRSVLFSTLAGSLEEAQQQFRNSRHSDSAALFIISTETSIYLT
jgi:hypothetical protein